MAWNRQQSAAVRSDVPTHRRGWPTLSAYIYSTNQRKQEERKTAGSRPPVTYLPSCRRQEDTKDSQTVRVVTRQRRAGVFESRVRRTHTHTRLHYPLHMADGTENTSRLHGSPERREKHRQKKLYWVAHSNVLSVKGHAKRRNIKTRWSFQPTHRHTTEDETLWMRPGQCWVVRSVRKRRYILAKTVLSESPNGRRTLCSRLRQPLPPPPQLHQRRALRSAPDSRCRPAQRKGVSLEQRNCWCTHCTARMLLMGAAHLQQVRV